MRRSSESIIPLWESLQREEIEVILDDDEPCYLISVAAQMVQVHPQTLRRYEEWGLVKPARVSGKRLYSPREIRRLRKIVRLMEDLGVNLAGVEIILRLTDQLEQLRAEMEQMQAEFEQELARLRRLAGS
ncbi:MAG: heat shock protein transcriptional repressor HspR [Anaerolineae bacterium]